MIALIQSAIEAYQYNAVTFVAETTYLRWNTTFPAVSVCEIENPDSIAEYSAKWVIAYILFSANKISLNVNFWQDLWRRS